MLLYGFIGFIIGFIVGALSLFLFVVFKTNNRINKVLYGDAPYYVVTEKGLSQGTYEWEKGKLIKKN